MKTFKRDNVVKKAESEVAINRLLSQGFVEIDEKGNPIEVEADESFSKLEEELAKVKAENEDLSSKLEDAKDEIKKLKADLKKTTKEG